MTKLILAASILLLGLFPGSFDKEKKKKKDKTKSEVSYHAEQAFFSQFGYMKDVAWQTTETNLYRANFDQDGEQISAFYSQNGDYVAHTINRDIRELPMKLRLALKNEFGDASFGEIIQMYSPEESCWFIEVKKDNGSEIWKGLSYGTLKKQNMKTL